MVRWCVARVLFPLVLGGSLAVAAAGLRAGAQPSLLVMAIILVSSAPVLLAQRLLPATSAWKAGPKDFGLDLLHMLSTGVSAEVSRSLTVGLWLAVAVWLRAAAGGHLWPTAWPLWLQLPLAIGIGDLSTYWVHRACHRFPLLWRVHAMHHSSERLHAFAGARNHPLNAVLAHGSQVLGITVLGAPVDIIALASVFTGVHGILQHANVDLRYGPLNWVFATADLHRWHHSTVRGESDTNFGNTLAVWDLIFRTRHTPKGRPEAVGLGGLDLPENFFVHLASPFVLKKWAAPPPAPALVPAVIAPTDRSFRRAPRVRWPRRGRAPRAS